jgi:uncharacterized protein YndB with AHSA1/START domain
MSSKINLESSPSGAKPKGSDNSLARKRDLKFEVTYPYPPENVWRALTDPQAIAQWLMKNNFEPRLGHKFQFRVEPKPRGWSGIVDCEILHLDPPRLLAYSWCGSGINTVVTWTLEPVAEGTRLRLEHRGFRGLRGWMVSRMLGKGWSSKILANNLPAVLARWSSGGPVPEVPEAHCTTHK